MTSYLHELYAHHQWADAAHWRAFEALPAALDDKAIRQRLHHIHLVQHGFLWITGPRTSPFVMKKIEDFPTMTSLKEYAQEGHRELLDLLNQQTPESLEEVIVVPWFQPPLHISRRHALMQAAMHSHYHRGQNATRLRELDGTPPTTDFIVWLRDGQPAAKWE